MYYPTHLEEPLDKYDALEMLARHDLDETVIEMVRDFGGETTSTALLKRIFLIDPDFSLVWTTQFAPANPTPLEEERSSGLIVALLALFGPSEEIYEETWGELLDRWETVTFKLLELAQRTDPQGPWLYGWLRFGAKLFQDAGAMRQLIWDRVVSQSINDHPCSAQIGKIWVDLLPPAADDMLALPRVGPARLTRIENKLMEILMPYGWEAQAAA